MGMVCHCLCRCHHPALTDICHLLSHERAAYHQTQQQEQPTSRTHPESSNVRMWTYDIETKIFTWRNEKGQAAFYYTVDDFSQRYHAGDFEQLGKAVDKLKNSQGGL